MGRRRGPATSEILVAPDDGLPVTSHTANEGERPSADQACSSCLRSEMWNFSFLFGFIDGNGLNLSL